MCLDNSILHIRCIVCFCDWANRASASCASCAWMNWFSASCASCAWRIDPDHHVQFRVGFKYKTNTTIPVFVFGIIYTVFVFRYFSFGKTESICTCSWILFKIFVFAFKCFCKISEVFVFAFAFASKYLVLTNTFWNIWYYNYIVCRCVNGLFSKLHKISLITIQTLSIAHMAYEQWCMVDRDSHCLKDKVIRLINEFS